MARVLIVDGEEAVHTVLGQSLRQDGHEILTATRAAEGIALATRAVPDLVLLELTLPDLPGIEVVRRLQASPTTRSSAVMVLSARSDELDRVLAFEHGATDYVLKPFSVRELVLRVRAVLRRAGPAPVARGVQVGALRIDEEGHRVWVQGREVELTFLEFKLLVALFAKRERVVSRDRLLVDVWCDATVTPRTVDTHVKRLREKLGPAGYHVQTVRGVGYRFSEQVDEVEGLG